MLEILELQGVVAAGLNKVEEARGFFERLLVLEPKFAPPPEWSPRVLTPFQEAKTLAVARGPLQLRPVRVAASDPRVQTLKVLVVDPLAMGRRVRFHVRLDGGSWGTQLVPVGSARAATQVQGDRIEWWAELVGEKEETLFALRDPDRPLVLGTEDAPLRAKSAMIRPAPNVTASPDEPASTLPAAGPEPKGSSLRPLGIAVLGGGVAAGAAGVFFAVRANAARQEIQNAERDAEGRIIGITQPRAYELERDANRNGTIATAMLIGAGAMVVAGTTLWILDGRVGVAPNGVTVSAKLP